MVDPDARSFGATLREARFEAGVTQRELGELAGVSQTVVSRIERGVGNHRPETYLRLRNALEILRQRGLIEARPKYLVSGYGEVLPAWARDELSQLVREVESLRIGFEEVRSYTEDIVSEISTLRTSVGTQRSRLDRVAEGQEMVSKELHAYLAALTLGLPTDDVPLFRVLPVRVYLDRSDADLVDRVSRELARLLEAVGFAISDEFPAIESSWFKKFFARSRDAVTSEEAKVALKQVERALRLPLDKQEAEIAQTYAEASAAFLEAVGESDVAVAQLGSLLILKRPDGAGGSITVTRTLTTRQAAALERHQDLLQRPDELLDFLANAEDLPDELPPGTP